jgi:epoxyqueuosine reductase
MGNWLFGCDDCQDVCPFNARAKETMWPEFRAERGTGPWVALEDVLSLTTPEAFKRRFGGTPLLRAKRAGLVRNACIAAANAGGLRPLLEERLRADSEPIVRGHAAWALRSAGAAARPALDAARKTETDPLALAEIEAALA